MHVQYTRHLCCQIKTYVQFLFGKHNMCRIDEHLNNTAIGMNSLKTGELLNHNILKEDISL